MASRHGANVRCVCAQLYVGERPWAGLRPVQIILKKTTGRANLAFPPGTPAAYKVLLAHDMSDSVASAWLKNDLT